MQVVNKTYLLEECTDSIIALRFRGCELIAIHVHSDLQTGKLILKNILYLLTYEINSKETLNWPFSKTYEEEKSPRIGK